VPCDLTELRWRVVDLGASEDVLDFLGAVGGEISDHLGRITAIIAQAMPYPGTQASLASLLHSLEKRGLISRDIRHRRTYSIKLTAPYRAPADESPTEPDQPRPQATAAAKGVVPSSPGPKAPHTPSDAWAAERAIYSAAIGRARERINEFEDQLAQATSETADAVRRADDLREQLVMAERTIDSMRTQLLDARKQIDILRRKGADRRPTPPAPAASRAAVGAEWDRLMRERPDR
jgi:hypothetical protein